ncbi:glycine N-acyltransferase-like protein 3 [Nerophis ophidion]|uniref:glycine N-acyltransferase-like protein 3 n=1 Tax=Nerophis ophidion TaxID=159077 RepID=UPI002AE02DAE|nr:glycine N-acyltransferase-like protein 3 [Nerophis ophidion]XP_061766544.1 glycine N-acyltransferase-like protein 3 [Nerophis ophidion]
MKILQKEEVLIAERVLLKYLPRSFQVYGFLYAFNRNKPSNVQFVVDQWPDFQVIMSCPDREQELTFVPETKIYCTDEKVLKKMLTEEDIIDWSAYILGVCNVSFTSMLNEVSTNRKVSYRPLSVTHSMYLPDSSFLLKPTFGSEVESKISSLNLSHVDLLNRTWKYGGDERGYNYITFLISNFPSYCITDDQGQPVSWILVYDYLAMGLLYTLPKYRQKGYATVLAHAMARKLLADDYPVYCQIDEKNIQSKKIFKNLGFTEDPSYRDVWFEYNI